MPFYFRFGVGPLRFSQRLGRTQTQKRAAAKRREEARGQRATGQGTYTLPYTVTGIEPDGTLVVRGGTGEDAFTNRLKPRRPVPGIAAGQVIEVVQAWGGGQVLEIRPGSAEAVAARQAADTYEERTHRYVVSQCRLDPLKGGDFTLEAEGPDSVHIRLDAQAVIHFLSLRKGDIVQLTHAPGNAGLEEFRQVCRSNGAKPRSPIELDDVDMEWLGLTATGPESDSC
jgi:hypothetical protein